MRIGNVKLKSNLWLSPIAGFSDLSFRLMIRPLGGVGMAFTELVNPRGLKNRTERSLQIVETCPEDKPLAVQLYGTEPEELAEAACWAADQGAAFVDINMGCPVPKVAGKGGGSGLLRTCPLAVRMMATIVKACPIPVTVKTRLGWEMGNLVAPALARQFEDVGVAGITIHGRYGEQKFAGSVDRDGIRQVVEAVSAIPVIGNGDVRSAADVKTMMEETGCAGVMIGRRALSDPWIFRDADQYLRTGTLPPPPTRIERTLLMTHHFELMKKHMGERSAVIQFRKKMSWYQKTIGPCPELRRKIPCLGSAAEFDELVGRFLDDLRAGRTPHTGRENTARSLVERDLDARFAGRREAVA